MKSSFGHFSESEIEKISLLLERWGVNFEVELDEEAGEDIATSMKNNLRYLHGATICNDMLMVKLDPQDLKALPEEAQKELEELRIYLAPEPDFEQDSSLVESPAPQKFINTQEPQRNGVVGLVFFFSLILSLVFFIINYFKD
ncbi:MAG: hypothetical protein WEB87_05555 [Bacteriovoracaceae bacterium]